MPVSALRELSQQDKVLAIATVVSSVVVLVLIYKKLFNSDDNGTRK
jgi:hypothetical protein